MGEKEENKLMKDALYFHLLGEGYSDFEARMGSEIISKKKIIQK